MLCTDGIHDNLTDAEIAETLRSQPPATAARKLVRQALHRSRQDSEQAMRAKPDDISAVVITCHQ